MADKVHIRINNDIYHELTQIVQQLNEGGSSNLSKALGGVLTQLTCDVLDQAFGVLVDGNASDIPQEHALETQKVLGQIEQQLKKYMPWAIGLFSNERLTPVANYILDQFSFDQSNHVFLYYAISPQLSIRVQKNYENLDIGHHDSISHVFQDLVEVIDAGVKALIREPKTMLKFNFVVNKTLDGVIQLVTNLGYKRIEKLGQHTSLKVAQHYAQHFQGFLRPIS